MDRRISVVGSTFGVVPDAAWLALPEDHGATQTRTCPQFKYNPVFTGAPKFLKNKLIYFTSGFCPAF